jgi:FMN phosphatase YigB (HAD superfamily)
LFVDNTKENLEPAMQLGWQTFWYRSENYEQSSKDLEQYLLQAGVI